MDVLKEMKSIYFRPVTYLYLNLIILRMFGAYRT